MDQLTKMREQLEMCDRVILDALRMRYDIVENITVYKKENGLGIVHVDEDARKEKFAEEVLKDERYKEAILGVYQNIRHTSKEIQSMNLFGHNIFLIGFMGAGKSTISSALQEVFAMEVVEMDQIIAQRIGMSISEIFETYGEPFFRNEETKLLVDIQQKKNVIVSCGGGVPLRDVNVEAMKKSGKIILLQAKAETILERVKGNHDRPLLENNKNVHFIADMMEKRREKYEAAADIVIETDGKSAYEICEEIIQKAKADC